MDSADAHVKQRSLVIVEVTRVRRPRIEMASQLEHVERAATLGCRGGLGLFQIGRQASRLLIPSLAVTGSGSDKRPLAGNFGPEEIGNLVETRIAGDLIPAGRADHLRNMRVHV